MKANIHPKWNHQAKVICACGHTFMTGSQQDEIHVDICSNCHPFFTGEMRFVDRQGRVDKFMQKMTTAQQKQAAKVAKKKAAGTESVAETDTKEPLSYKQLLQQEQNKLKNLAKNRAAGAITGTQMPTTNPTNKTF